MYVLFIPETCSGETDFRDKQVALIGGQTGSPYWGTKRLPLLGDKQVALIGGQTGSPYWGTNREPILREKQGIFTTILAVTVDLSVFNLPSEIYFRG